MTDTPWAAREGDALLHSSMLADVLGGVLEIAASVAVTALATAAVVAAPGDEPACLDIAEGFFSQLWRPTVATPALGAVPCPGDKVDCDKHPPMPDQYMAEGSSRVFINGQPAVRSGDRSTCEAKVGTAQVSPNVIIGGAPVVVREIRSGKTPGVGLVSWGSSQVSNAITSAVAGSPNPVHSATGAKILDGEDDLDFTLPGLLPIEWQRYYSSRDERQRAAADREHRWALQVV